jgi:Tfp pilus assembly protein FimT
MGKLHARKSKNGGIFTVYELLITIFMIGIVLTIGIPGFSEFTQNGRITSTANELHSSFHLGRSEAARSKSNVTICASANSMAAAAACGGSAPLMMRRFSSPRVPARKSSTGNNSGATRALPSGSMVAPDE